MLCRERSTRAKASVRANPGMALAVDGAFKELPGMLEDVAVVLFPIALAYAAIRDLASYEIPNWLSLAIAADFLAAALAGSPDLAVIGWHLSAGLAVLLVGALLFARGMLGGGDAKLLAACAVWVGWSGLPQFFLVVSVAGGLLALLILCFRRAGLPRSWAQRAWILRLHSDEKGIPYGVAIGVGGVLMLGDLPLVGSLPVGVLAH